MGCVGCSPVWPGVGGDAHDRDGGRAQTTPRDGSDRRCRSAGVRAVAQGQQQGCAGVFQQDRDGGSFGDDRTHGHRGSLAQGATDHVVEQLFSVPALFAGRGVGGYVGVGGQLAGGRLPRVDSDDLCVQCGGLGGGPAQCGS